MPCLENNSVMNYSDIFNFFMIILVIVSILTIFIKMPFHIILTSKVVNQDIKIDLNLRYMFNIININIPIYLRKVESKKKELKKSKRKLIKKLKSRKILARDVFAICRQLKKIDIEESIKKLPEDLQEVVILHYFQDLKLKEVADIIGIGLPLVKYRIGKAKELLSVYLGDKK